MSEPLSEILKKLARTEAELREALEAMHVSDDAMRERAKPFRTPVTPEVMALAAQG